MRALIVTTMRNEATVVLEWLAYHQAIGFTDFLIYTNDCDDGTDVMLDRLAADGILVHERNPRAGQKTVQWQALGRAADHPLIAQVDWIYGSDVDEFLVIHPGAGRLQDLIDVQPDASGFALSWRMFGSNGLIDLTTTPVTSRFSRAAPDRLLWPWRAVQHKALYRNNGTFAKLGVHRPLKPDADKASSFQWVDDRGQKVQGQLRQTVGLHDGPRYQLAQINHYAVGSVQDFVLKSDRGKPNRTGDPIDLNYWVERNFNTVEDRSIARFKAEIAQRTTAFLQDPEIRQLLDNAQQWRRDRVATLMADRNWSYLAANLEALPNTQVLSAPRQHAQLLALQAALTAEAAAAAK
jgi:hypothetical protein